MKIIDRNFKLYVDVNLVLNGNGYSFSFHKIRCKSDGFSIEGLIKSLKKASSTINYVAEHEEKQVQSELDVIHRQMVEVQKVDLLDLLSADEAVNLIKSAIKMKEKKGLIMACKTRKSDRDHGGKKSGRKTGWKRGSRK